MRMSAPRKSAPCRRATTLARQKFQKANACACSKVAGQLVLGGSRPWQIATGKGRCLLGFRARATVAFLLSGVRRANHIKAREHWIAPASRQLGGACELCGTRVDCAEPLQCGPLITSLRQLGW